MYVERRENCVKLGRRGKEKHSSLGSNNAVEGRVGGGRTEVKRTGHGGHGGGVRLQGERVWAYGDGWGVVY